MKNEGRKISVVLMGAGAHAVKLKACRGMRK
jgi:hypothetical protein